MIFRIKRAHLVLKSPLTVVRPLRLDVSNQGPNVHGTYGEQAVSTLPGEVPHALLLHPDRGTSLDLRYNLRRNFRRRQPQRQMNMVCNAARPEALATQFPRSACKIGMQCRGKFIGYQRPAVFCTEDDMHQVEAQRLRHARDYMSGLQPSTKYPTADLGLRPRLVCHRTYGPSIGAGQTISQSQIRT